MPHYVLDARTATPHFPGIGRYVRSLARALAPSLQPQERLTILHHPDHPFDLPPTALASTLPVHVSPFTLAQQWAIPRLLRRLDADLYHSAYYLMPYLPGVPALLTVHDLIPLLFPDQSSAAARLLFGWATALALRAAHHVITISEATHHDCVTRFRLATERLTTIPEAADPAFRPQSEARIAQARARYHLPARYLLYVGSNKPHKNLARLVEAWAMAESTWRAEEVGLVIAGHWDARYDDARQRGSQLGIEASILFAGPIAEADLPAVYGGARLFVFPSLYEGFGLPVLEAMACGVPVITSDTSSLPEVAGGAALLVDPLDVGGVAAAIERGLSEEVLRGELREAGLQQAARFNWAETARQTLALYRRHAKSAGSSPQSD